MIARRVRPAHARCAPTWMVAATAAVAMAGVSAHADDAAEPPAATETAAPGETMRVLYNGYFGPFRVMKVSFDAALTDGAYQADAVFRTAGLAGFFQEARIHASANGAVEDADIQPLAYQHRNLASKKNRQIRIDFSPDDVAPTITPPFGSMGQPPATREERMQAVDPVSSFLHLMRPGEEPCGRTVAVFDGKQRYNLRVEDDGADTLDVRAWDGPVRRCRIFYEPISGFDPEDLADPEVYDRPIVIWFADLGDGVHAPVRIRARAQGLSVTVEAKSIERRAG